MKAKNGGTEQGDIKVLSEVMVSLGFESTKIDVDTLDQELLKTFNDLELPDVVYTKYGAQSAITEVAVYKVYDEVRIEVCEPIGSRSRLKGNVIIQKVRPFKTVDYQSFHKHVTKHKSIDIFMFSGDN